MGPVERAVRAALDEGVELRTPGRDRPFWVDRLHTRGIVLLLGKGRHETTIPWEALEGIPELLRGRDFVPTTGSFALEADSTSFSGYLKQFVNRETANWVAVVLERAGVVELNRTRPVSARLTAAFR